MKAYIYNWKKDSFIFVCSGELLTDQKWRHDIPDSCEPMIVDLPFSLRVKKSQLEVKTSKDDEEEH